MHNPVPEQQQLAASALFFDVMVQPASPYLQRLSRQLGKLLPAPDDAAQPLFVLVPPGIDTVLLLSRVLESAAVRFETLDCRVLAGADILARLRNASGAYALLAHPECLDDNTRAAVLLFALERKPHCLLLSAVPFWLLQSGVGLMGATVMDYRDFCYSQEDVQFLLRQIDLDCQQDYSGEYSAQDVLKHTSGWPLVSELFLAAVNRLAEAGTAVVAGPAPSVLLAESERVRYCFEASWLPLVEQRYAWLPTCRFLPRINLDLLLHLYPDIGSGVQECRALGWLQVQARNPGYYLLNTTLDGMLRRVARHQLDVNLLESAARWYEREGFWSEAIECLVVLGADDERLSDLQEKSGRAQPRQRGVGQSLLELGPAGGVARNALGPHRGAIGSPKAGIEAITRGLVRREPRAGESVAAEHAVLEAGPAGAVSSEMDALLHIASAWHHHRLDNSVAVASAVAGVLDSPGKREQLSTLLEFIDIHVRPLLQQRDSPLGQALKDVRIAAPAREAMATRYQSLNHRELQILQRICEGYRNREISEQLGLELSTIKWYSTRIYEKLQVRNRTQAAAKARALQFFE